MLKREPLVPHRRDTALEHAAVQDRTVAHPLYAENGRDLDDGFDVISRVEEGKALREDGEEDDAGGPDIDFGGLGGAFEEDFWGAEAAGAGAVGAAGRALVVFWVTGGRGLVGSFAEVDFGAAGWGRVLAEAVGGVCAFTLLGFQFERLYGVL